MTTIGVGTVPANDPEHDRYDIDEWEPRFPWRYKMMTDPHARRVVVAPRKRRRAIKQTLRRWLPLIVLGR